MLYYCGDGGLYVSQYLASRVKFEAAGANYTLENCSFYPKEKTLRFKLYGEQKGKFAIRFRVPSWACGENIVSVNREHVTVSAKPDTWLTL